MPKVRKFLLLELIRVCLLSAFQPMRSLFLLVAIQYFYIESEVKGLIPAADFIGFLVSPIIISLFVNMKKKSSETFFYLYLISACGFLIIGLSNNFYLFLLGVLIAVGFPAIDPPLTTTVWQDNVKQWIRGKLYGNIAMAGLLVKTISGLVISYIVANDLENFKYLSLFFCFVLIATAFTSKQIPSKQITSISSNPFKRFSLLKENIFICMILASWFLIGSAHLITYPLRTEYLAAGRDFIAYEPFQVLLLVEVIPNLFRMLSVQFWGKIFDKMNFLIFRMIGIALSGVSLVLFFLPFYSLQLLSAVLFGIFMAGADIGWSLWLTKYVPKNRVTDYMSIHIFLTGIRGSTMPFVGFFLIASMSFQEVAQIGVFMIFLSFLIILKLYWQQKSST